ncbi:MAG: hypothetical protein WC757_00580 [Candidatus Paceibacterota bacterium]
MRHYKNILGIGLGVISIIGILLFVITFQTMTLKSVPEALAVTGPGRALTGTIWSSNVGWVSLNCISANGDESACSPTRYGVFFDEATKTFSGAAWSNNVGWITFNAANVLNCANPDTASVVSTSGQAAQIRADNRLVGWARVYSEIGRSDGWNGCIDLSGTTKGTASSYVPATGVISSGSVWGSEVFGWGQLQSVKVNSAVTFSCTGARPLNTLVCANDESGLTANTTWTSRSGSSGCTTALKCEYYPDPNYHDPATKCTQGEFNTLGSDAVMCGAVNSTNHSGNWYNLGEFSSPSEPTSCGGCEYYTRDTGGGEGEEDEEVSCSLTVTGTIGGVPAAPVGAPVTWTVTDSDGAIITGKTVYSSASATSASWGISNSAGKIIKPYSTVGYKKLYIDDITGDGVRNQCGTDQVLITNNPSDIREN